MEIINPGIINPLQECPGGGGCTTWCLQRGQTCSCNVVEVCGSLCPSFCAVDIGGCGIRVDPCFVDLSPCFIN